MSPPGQSQPPPGQARSAPAPARQQQQLRSDSGSASAHSSVAVRPQPQYMPPLISPENLGIDPFPDAGNDVSLAFEWRVVTLGTNQTLGCKVTAEGSELTVQIEQGHYNKTVRGAGSVDIPAVPVAAVGTTGRLRAVIDATGANATFSWEWQTPAVRRELQAKAKAAAQEQAKQAGKQSAGASKRTPVLTKEEAQQAAREQGKVATAFFGQHAIGRRFAFILDMSGSMSGSCWERCVQELTASLSNLPEDVEFCVVLFSSELAEPPGQSGWMLARHDTVKNVIFWLNKMRPDGGTYPAPAFDRVFSFRGRPDVVYFLTDGVLEGFTPADCARVRRSSTTSKLGSAVRSLGKLFSFSGADPEPDTIVNTIALDDASTPALQQMAAESGGEFVHVRSK